MKDALDTINSKSENPSDQINRLQQMKDIIKLSSIALISIVWTIISFIAYQNKLLKQKISQTTTTPSPIANQVPTGNLDSQVSNGNLANWKM